MVRLFLYIMNLKKNLLLLVISTVGVASNIYLQLILLHGLATPDDEKIFLSCLAIPVFATAVIYGPYQNILVSKFSSCNLQHITWRVAFTLFILFSFVAFLAPLSFHLWAPLYFGDFMISTNQSAIFYVILILVSAIPFNIAVSVLWAQAIAERKLLEVETVAFLAGALCILSVSLLDKLTPIIAAAIYAIRYPIQLILMSFVVRRIQFGFDLVILRELLDGAEWASIFSFAGRFDQIAERAVLVREPNNILTGYFVSQQCASLLSSVSVKLVVMRLLPDLLSKSGDSRLYTFALRRTKILLTCAFFLSLIVIIFVLLLRISNFKGFVSLFFSGFGPSGFFFATTVLCIGSVVGSYSEMYSGLCHSQNKSNILAMYNGLISLIVWTLKLWLGTSLGWSVLPFLTLASYLSTLYVSKNLSKP